MVDIDTVIAAINANGIQGPQDLRNLREYGWVKQSVDIDYDSYIELLLDHCIDEAERDNIRNAYVIRDKKGRLSRFKSTEAELRGLICYVVAQEPHITSDIIKSRVKLAYHDATPVDLMLQVRLDSPQEIIDQTIRNVLVSNYANNPNRSLLVRSAKPPYTFTLTPKGEALAREIGLKLVGRRETVEDLEYPVTRGALPYDSDELADLSKRVFTGKPTSGAPKIYYPVDPRLTATCRSLAIYRCEADSSHDTFLAASGHPYVESHHLVPMAAQKSYRHINLDSLDNLVALCPLCHRAIHHGTPSVREKLLQPLLQSRLKRLKAMGFSDRDLTDIALVFYDCRLHL